MLDKQRNIEIRERYGSMVARAGSQEAVVSSPWTPGRWRVQYTMINKVARAGSHVYIRPGYTWLFCFSKMEAEQWLVKYSE